MIADKKLQMLRDNYEVAYNEAVRLGYDMLSAIDKADEIRNREEYFRKAARAKHARDKCSTAAEQVSDYITGRYPGNR